MYYKIHEAGKTFYEIYTWEYIDDGFTISAANYDTNYNPNEAMFLSGVLHYEIKNMFYQDTIKYANQQFIEVSREKAKCFNGFNQGTRHDGYHYKVRKFTNRLASYYSILCNQNRMNINVFSGYSVEFKKLVYTAKQFEKLDLDKIKNTTIHPYYHLISALNPELFYKAANVYGWDKYLLCLYPLKPTYNKIHFENWINTSIFKDIKDDLIKHEVKDFFEMTMSDLMALSENKYKMFHFVWMNMPDRFRVFYQLKEFKDLYPPMRASGFYADRILYHPILPNCLEKKEFSKVKGIITKCPKDISEDDFKKEYVKFDYFVVWGSKKDIMILHPWLANLKKYYEMMLVADSDCFAELYKVVTDFEYFKLYDLKLKIQGKQKEIHLCEEKIKALKEQTDKQIKVYENNLAALNDELQELENYES